MDDRKQHVSERFGRLLSLYRKPDGGEWGGRNPESATDGSSHKAFPVG